MDTVVNHVHNFESQEAVFQPSNAVAFTNQRVVRENYPVLTIFHDHGGKWQFMCGSDDPGECLIVCLGCAYERDKTVGLVADLPVGWLAWRETVNDRWNMPRLSLPLSSALGAMQ